MLRRPRPRADGPSTRGSESRRKSSRFRLVRWKARGAATARQVGRLASQRWLATTSWWKRASVRGSRVGTVFTAGELVVMAKGLRRGGQDLGEDETRRGERRRGQLNPGLEARTESRSKASKSSYPEMAAAGSWSLSRGRWKAGSRRVVTAGRHESAKSRPRLRRGRNP